MWYATAGVAIVASSTFIATRVLSPTKLSARLDHVTSIESLVQLLKAHAVKRSTEDVVSDIVVAIEEEGLSERALMHLSSMHKQYGRDMGARGYAINLVWSSITHAIQTGPVVIWVD